MMSRVKRLLGNTGSTTINRRFDQISMMLGYLMVNQQNSTEIQSLEKAEFQVFSQFGDDGIIQYLINSISIENKKFVEIGVEDYKESNTRFLLQNNNWKGLVIDGSIDNIQCIKNSELYWKYDITAVESWVTIENINQILVENSFLGDIGLLSIDVDGMDYYIFEAIEVISPRILIIEYNSLFEERSVVVPYEKNFDRSKAHFNHMYFGASLNALKNLGAKKGYEFIGCNKNGINAYFLRRDIFEKSYNLEVNHDFVRSKIRQSRNEQNQLNYLSFEECLKQLEGLEVYNVDTNKIEFL